MKVNEFLSEPDDVLKTKELDELTQQEIDDLSIEDLDYLRQKYPETSSESRPHSWRLVACHP